MENLRESRFIPIIDGASDGRTENAESRRTFSIHSANKRISVQVSRIAQMRIRSDDSFRADHARTRTTMSNSCISLLSAPSLRGPLGGNKVRL